MKSSDSVTAHQLSTGEKIGFIATIRLMARAYSFVRFFKGRTFIKWFASLIALMFPVFMLPWGTKILIDHVVLGEPITGTQGFPPHFHSFVMNLQGAAPSEIMLWLAGLFAIFVVLFGAYSGEQRDETEAGILDGMDTATQQENLTHGGHSHVGGIFGYYEYKMNARLTQSINHLLRTKLFAKIGALPMTKLDDQRIGDSVYRVLWDTPSINQIFYEIIRRPTLSTAVFAAAVYNMATAYPGVPQVVWCAAIIFPVFIIITGPFSSWMRRVQLVSRKAGAATTSTIEEGMDNVLAVQSLGGNEKEKDRFGSDSQESFKRFRFAQFVEILLGNAQGLAHAVVSVTVTIVICDLIIDGELTVGDYGALMFYFGWMRGPAVSFSTLWIHLQRYMPGMQRVFEILDLPQESEMGKVVLEPVSDGIQMRDVRLAYPDGRIALNNVSLDAKVGQIVAFVGPTGAGKTSLAFLIPRYHVASAGTVTIDGTNVNDLTMTSLRQQVTYVFQETQLFSDTILNNVRFGKPDASLGDVQHVCEIAGAHNFIKELPEGYETPLGSSALSKLSVGQKQRLSIARGLLRDSSVLILDEPTSALDPETEKYLVESLHEAAKDRLVIIIAHRLSTIREAHQIVFLEDGNVMEVGSHKELTQIEGGRYKQFVDLQTTDATKSVN